MSGHTCEILLIVALLVVLAIWYWTSFHRRFFPSRGALNKSGAQQKLAVNYAAQVTAPAAVNDLDPAYQDAGYVRRMAITPPPFETLDEEDTSVGVAPSDPWEGRAGDITEGFAPFEDAPNGIKSTEWTGDVTDTTRDSIASTKEKHSDATRHQYRFQLDSRNRLSTQDGQRRLSRVIGARGGVTPDMMSDFLECDKTSKAKVDCSKIEGSLNLPESHPCFDTLMNKILAEDMARNDAVGNASFAQATLSQPRNSRLPLL